MQSRSVPRPQTATMEPPSVEQSVQYHRAALGLPQTEHVSFGSFGLPPSSPTRRCFVGLA